MREKRNTQSKFLQKYHFRPSKKLGQNFLISQKVLYKIIGASDLSANDIVLEIGPGLGILTIELARRVKKVIAVEKDKRMVEALKKILAENKIENVEITQGDILKLIPNDQWLQLSFPRKRESRKFSGAMDSRESGNDTREDFRDSSLEILPQATCAEPNRSKSRDDHYKVIANIPYYLTSPLIRKLLESDNPPQSMTLMIQKEVAQRICASPAKIFAGQKFRRASPPRMSLLSVSVQFYAAPKIISYVSRESFWPQPEVDSAIIKITPSPLAFPISQLEKKYKNTFRDHFFKIVHAGFSHPRKQLANNLSTELKISRQKIENFLEKVQLKPTQRAEELTVDNWRILTVLIVENIV